MALVTSSTYPLQSGFIGRERPDPLIHQNQGTDEQSLLINGNALLQGLPSLCHHFICYLVQFICATSHYSVLPILLLDTLLQYMLYVSQTFNSSDWRNTQGSTHGMKCTTSIKGPNIEVCVVKHQLFE